jgi:hypothetical protein
MVAGYEAVYRWVLAKDGRRAAGVPSQLTRSVGS